MLICSNIKKTILRKKLGPIQKSWSKFKLSEKSIGYLHFSNISWYEHSNNLPTHKFFFRLSMIEDDLKRKKSKEAEKAKEKAKEKQ